MTTNTLRATLLVSSLLLCGACGGTAPAADTPDDAAGGATDDAAPADGIVRDADGDGVADDTEETVDDCTGKDETQCKINMNCAWSDQETCVPASAGSM